MLLKVSARCLQRCKWHRSATKSDGIVNSELIYEQHKVTSCAGIRNRTKFANASCVNCRSIVTRSRHKSRHVRTGSDSFPSARLYYRRQLRQLYSEPDVSAVACVAPELNRHRSLQFDILEFTACPAVRQTSRRDTLIALA